MGLDSGATDDLRQAKVTAILKAIRSVLWTLLVRWLFAIVQFLRHLWAACRAALDRGQLPGRTGRGADSTCVPIRHPAFRRPDPLIYSQSYLMSLGLGVTWDNPDVQLQRNGATVSSSQIDADTDYDIVARIWNGSNNAPIAGLPVEFSFIDFGMGGVTTLIGTTQVDLGVKGGPGCPTFATVPWHTPSLPGHYCLLVKLSWIDDANPLNNVGQENLTIGQAHSPAPFAFTLRNDTDERKVFTFEVDAYEIPELRPCEEVPRPSLRELQRRSVAPAAARVAPTLSASVRRRHDRSAYPVPEGWTVAFDPAEVGLAAGEAQTVRVSVEPESSFRGSRRINVRAVAGQHVAGGVTLVVEKS